MAPAVEAGRPIVTSLLQAPPGRGYPLCRTATHRPVSLPNERTRNGASSDRLDHERHARAVHGAPAPLPPGAGVDAGGVLRPTLCLAAPRRRHRVAAAGSAPRPLAAAPGRPSLL